MLRDLIKRIKTSEKENSDRNSEPVGPIAVPRQDEHTKLGAVVPRLSGGIRPVSSEFPTVYCIQSKCPLDSRCTRLLTMPLSFYLLVQTPRLDYSGAGEDTAGKHLQVPRAECQAERKTDPVDFDIFSKETAPNHVLINQYEQCMGILPHKDGPLYYPRVAIISLESDTLFDFWSPSTDVQENKRPLFSLIVPRLSLLVFQDSCYTQLLHGIASRIPTLTCLTNPKRRNQDNLKEYNVLNLGDFPQLSANSTLRRGFRTSLTFRYVKPGE
ncbi:alpha-ketoglutarate-dependent dioxygenase AlkB [Cryptosporidium canis]|uniref:Alpha-ketoglutarate-dependent dioxygenase AlkB n=1 Tax=Cryptosporidium canis TaxID=195482 RepID=A0A9D5HXB8_9CRYT|nr:alpha-ketoglutarate-dependent dioxygenase AlkB [Cryptosporidium canis]